MDANTCASRTFIANGRKSKIRSYANCVFAEYKLRIISKALCQASIIRTVGLTCATLSVGIAHNVKNCRA